MKRVAVAIAILFTVASAVWANDQDRPATARPQGQTNRGGDRVDPRAQELVRETNVSLPRMPSISPDGKTIVFAWHGDLWSVPTEGGRAFRLSSHPSEESSTRFSPDGSRIAFTSDRRGSPGLFTMNADGTGVAEVLAFDRAALLTDWATGEDGGRLLFTGTLEPDNYRSPRPYTVPAEGGVYERLHGAFGRAAAQEPGGMRVLFERGGSGWDRRHYRGPDARNVWLHAPGAADEFVQLTAWAGNDGKARWAGKDKFVYASDRNDDTTNLYLYDLAAGAKGEEAARRLTNYDDRDVEDFDVTPDGKTLVFARWDALHTLDLTRPGAQPRPVNITAAEDERDNVEYVTTDARVTDAALSPDGKTMALIAYGQLYVRGTEDNSASRRVSVTLAEHKEVAWSPDGGTLYFTSDESGRDAIYAVTATRTRGEIVDRVKKYRDANKPGATQPATQPATQSAAPTTTTLPATDEARQRGAAEPSTAPDPAKWADAIAFNVELVSESPAGDSAPVPAHDGVHIALTRGVGEIWTRNLETGAEQRIYDGWSDTPGYVWTSDGKHLVFTTQDADFNTDVWVTRTDGTGWRGEGRPVNVSRHPMGDGGMSLSHDNRVLTFASSRGNNPQEGGSGGGTVYRVYLDPELEGLAPAELEEYYKSLSERVKKVKTPEVPAWAKARGTVSPKARELATRPSGDGATREAVETATRDPNQQRRTADAAGTRPATRLTTQSTTQPTTRPAPLSISQLRQALRAFILEDEAGGATTRRSGEGPRPDREARADEPIPTLDDFPLDQAYLRLRSIATGAGRPLLLPDASAVYYSGSGGTFRAAWNGQPQRVGEPVSLRGMTPKGDKLFYTASAAAAAPGGRGGAGGGGGGGGTTGGFFDTTGGRAHAQRSVAPSDRLKVELAEMNERKFLDMARTLGDQFYHPTMKGLDWGALTKQYLPLARAARTNDEFEHVAGKLLGELNASHLGVTVPGGAGASASARQSFGHLGIRTEVGEDGFVVKQVMETGPAGRGPMRLEAGDVITHLELEAVETKRPLEYQLADRVGREIVVGVKRNTQSLDLLLTPVSYGAIGALSYDAWRNEANRKVAELSGGRLGYIHVRGMDEGSLETFVRDLYAAAEGKDGLIVDVRNNGGGWTADRLLASIMYPRHAYTIPRGLQDSAEAGRANGERGGYPNDRLFIPRYDLPMNMLCNEKSFSNAEIISHAFKTLKRGTLVGEQTAGGVISTGAFRLVDGTSVRLPFRGWYLPDGTDMENNGAMPDVRVVQTPEAESADADEQLDAAVTDLLKRLPPKERQAAAGE